MTARQYLAALKTLGLTPYAAAKYLGITTSHAYKLANGAPVTRTIELLLNAYLRHGLPPEETGKRKA